MATENVPEWMQKLRKMKGDDADDENAAAKTLEEKIAASKRASQAAAGSGIDQELAAKLRRSVDEEDATASTATATMSLDDRIAASKRASQAEKSTGIDNELAARLRRQSGEETPSVAESSQASSTPGPSESTPAPSANEADEIASNDSDDDFLAAYGTIDPEEPEPAAPSEQASEDAASADDIQSTAQSEGGDSNSWNPPPPQQAQDESVAASEASQSVAEESVANSSALASEASSSAGGVEEADTSALGAADEEIIDDDEEIIIDDDGNEIHDEEIMDEEEIIVDEFGNEIEEEVIVEDDNGAAQFVPGMEKALDPEGQYGDEEDQKEAPPEGPTKEVRRAWEPCKWSFYTWAFIWLVVIGTFLILLFTVILNKEDNPATASPTMSPGSTTKPPVAPPTPTAAPTKPPSNALEDDDTRPIEDAATTAFDPLQPGDCDFTGLIQPHVLDQCACNGRIDTVATDVVDRYDFLIEDWLVDYDPDFSESINSCSARNQALVWLSTSINNAGTLRQERLNRFVLAEVFIAAQGLNWTQAENWLTIKNSCAWQNVACDASAVRNVVGLSLGNNGLQGELASAITFLESLRTLEVQMNPSLGGALPAGILELQKLVQLDVSGDSFSGPFPTITTGGPLEEMNLADNSFSGVLPSNIDLLSNLRIVDLSFNNFGGVLPVTLFRLLSMQVLDLEGNNFSGEIPSEVAGVLTLQSLNFNDNNFGGTIDIRFATLTNLESFSITNSPNFGGTLPREFGWQFSKLTDLTISGTDVFGAIPTYYGLMSNLVTMDLSNNRLRSRIPSELGELSALEILRLQENAFTDGLPTQLANLNALTEFRVNDNQLEGLIPSVLSNLMNLQAMTVDGNFFVGRMADGICALRQASLVELVADCPDEGGVGVLCGVPTCCTTCR